MNSLFTIQIIHGSSKPSLKFNKRSNVLLYLNSSKNNFNPTPTLWSVHVCVLSTLLPYTGNTLFKAPPSGRKKELCVMFLLAIASQCSLLCGMPTTTTATTVRFSSLGYRVLIGCDKSCDIRIIDDIIVSCQQGQRIQYV